MELTLLGTGAPGGLPLPGCPCASCATAVGADARTATSVFVDGALLLDLTPDAVQAAARAGRSLRGVRQVLLSHPHTGPAVDVPAGLPAPGRVPDGRELALISGHRVRAVAVDAPGTGYSVTGPDGDDLLYLPPGAAPAGMPPRPAPYGVVLLDVLGRPEALARLRAAGAVTATTDVIGVHLGHGTPPGTELHRRLAAAGARAVPDGTALGTRGHPVPPAPPRRTLVLGGARSGKSAEAERRLESYPEVLYVATGGTREGDREWAARVSLHRERRPGSWRTTETCDLVPLLAGDGPPLLIDCLALWLTHAMDAVDAWDDEVWAAGGGQRALRARTEALVSAIRSTRRTVVAVSNEVGSGVVPATASGRRFRDELGRLNAAVAAECEHVLLVVAGQALALRG
ncbi:bifunctional adenosylcobinamide kinase/adenosylcobinamide-phosphate guanylyltransferase [Streptomyces xinghaiensis]|uniref:bifunctional adenosylcobinamide kinase/adenosylcobinamide-phosphate guanylyltransferase n=1 Tax=Streptomyces xinghaiensis TaxID=1038928 RepID=UPI000BAFBCE7|nr:bifunctional adenosylcobinamide kinase/adenosylcobinamide-phosphate guanylyltransferase [Streptomyces xinghaiensis]